MASVQNFKTEKTPQNISSFEVITLSSDEEECSKSHEDVNFLFKRFILACRPHVTKEAIKVARQTFTEVKEKLGASHDLANMFERYSKELKKENASMYLELICNAMNNEKPGDHSTVLECAVKNEKRAEGSNSHDVKSPRDFEQKAQPPGNQNVAKDHTNKPLEISIVSDDDDDFVSERSRKKHAKRNGNIKPSTSGAYKDTKAGQGKEKINTKTLTKGQKKKLVARLKQRLKEINNEIKILDRAELTLEEMDMCDSIYIQEHRLKMKFEKTWNKLCKLQGRPPNTGRVVEKHVRASSTGYSIIDEAIAKFLKEKHGSFPNFFDIRDVVMKTNKKHDLRMTPKLLSGIIADIFTDIGNKLQKQREKDLLFNFGSHLLDDFKTEKDPALTSEELTERLEKNRKVSKRNLKNIYAKYTHLERYESDDKSRLKRKTSPSMVHSSRLLDANRDNSGESGTSDDEQDCYESTRLEHHEVRGKSRRKRKGPSQWGGFTQVVDRDSSGESGTSDDEQDCYESTRLEHHEARGKSRRERKSPSRWGGSTRVVDRDSSGESGISENISRTKEDSFITLVEDSKAPSSQDCCVLIAPANISPSEHPCTSQNNPVIPSTDISISSCVQPLGDSSSLDHPVTTQGAMVIPSTNVALLASHQPSTSQKAPVIDISTPNHPVTTKSAPVISLTDNVSDQPSTSQGVAIKSSSDMSQSLSDQQVTSQSVAEISSTSTSNPYHPVISQSTTAISSIDRSESPTFPPTVPLNKNTNLPESHPTESTAVLKPDNVMDLEPDLSDDVVELTDAKCHSAQSVSSSNHSARCPGTERTTSSSSLKRKASQDLRVEITNSTFSCLEKIAMALKNKKLKLPDCWTEKKNTSSSLSKPTTSKQSSAVSDSLCENNPVLLVKSKAKIDLHQRQVFREKTLNALKLSKPICNSNVNNSLQDLVDVTPSNKTLTNICLPNSVENGLSSKTNETSIGNEQCEVIIIDDD